MQKNAAEKMEVSTKQVPYMQPFIIRKVDRNSTIHQEKSSWIPEVSISGDILNYRLGNKRKIHPGEEEGCLRQAAT